MAKTRNATITVDWPHALQSVQLDVEAPGIPSQISLSCPELEETENWIPDSTYAYHYISGDYYFDLFVNDDIESDPEVYVDLYQSGDLEITMTARSEDGTMLTPNDNDCFYYALRVYNNTLQFTATCNLNALGNYSTAGWLGTELVYVTITVKYSRYNLTATYSFIVPPFSNSNLIEWPDNSTIATYYRHVNDPLTVTLTSYGEKYQQYFKEWIKYGILNLTAGFNHAHDFDISGNPSTDAMWPIFWPDKPWNSNPYYNPSDPENYVDLDDFKDNFSSSLSIKFKQPIFGDCEIYPVISFKGGSSISKETVYYMVNDPNGYSHTVASIISNASGRNLYYAPGYVIESTSGSESQNLLKYGLYITSSPTLVTTSSSGFSFNVGSSGSRQVGIAALILGFTEKTIATEFREMVMSGLIRMYMNTPGSSTSVFSLSNYSGYPYMGTLNMHVPCGSSNAMIYTPYPSISGLNTATYPTDDMGSSGNYSYLVLFHYTDIYEYNESGMASAYTQGVRLRYENMETGDTTQHSSPSYFYGTSSAAFARLMNYDM